MARGRLKRLLSAAKRMLSLPSRLGHAAAEWIPETFLLGGAAAVIFGVWQIYRPAGWIALGLIAVGTGWLLGRTQQETERG